MPSTVISSFHYDAARKILKVIFVSGMVYAYKQVPEEVYEKFKTAFSKGIFLNRYIKPYYDVEKIDP